MVGAAAVEAIAPIEFDRVLIVLSSFVSRPPSIFFLSRGTKAKRRTEDREMNRDDGLAAFLLFGHERSMCRIPRRSVFVRMANFKMKEHGSTTEIPVQCGVRPVFSAVVQPP